jgi:hypothetical protein
MTFKHWLASATLDDNFPLPLDQPFTTAMAMHAGLSLAHLKRLRDAGLIRTQVKGVHVARQAADSVALRAQALALVVPTDSVVGDRHAAWLAGASMVLAPNEHLELQPISMFRPSGRGRLRNDLSKSGERRFATSDLMEVNGLRVTTPLRTAWDLGRLQRRDRAFAGLDAMLRLGVFSQDELLEGVERFRGQRGVRQLRHLGPLSDGRAESPGESVLRLRWLDAGIPTPEPQLEVTHEGLVIARLDLGLDSVKFAAEYDGAEWHSSPDQRAHDQRRRALLADGYGWFIVAVDRTNVHGPRQNCEELLLAGIAKARSRFGARTSG